MANSLITLSKPYVFEDETYTEINLQGLEDLKAKDLSVIDKIHISKGCNPAMSGLTIDYAMITASMVAKKPLEFFEELPAKDAMAIKNMVMSFFYKGA